MQQPRFWLHGCHPAPLPIDYQNWQKGTNLCLTHFSSHSNVLVPLKGHWGFKVSIPQCAYLWFIAAAVKEWEVLVLILWETPGWNLLLSISQVSGICHQGMPFCQGFNQDALRLLRVGREKGKGKGLQPSRGKNELCLWKLLSLEFQSFAQESRCTCNFPGVNTS